MHGSGRCLFLLYVQTLIWPCFPTMRSLIPISVSSGISWGRKTRHSPQRPSSIGQGENMLSFRTFRFRSFIFSESHRSDMAQTIISMEVLYCIGTAAFKFSALLFFHRIFGSVPRLTAFLWCLVFVILANNIAEIFLSIFQCTPVHKAWSMNVQGSCVNILLAACIPGSINVISDVITVLLPIPMIWNLHVERNRKIQLVGIFLLSGL